MNSLYHNIKLYVCYSLLYAIYAAQHYIYPYVAHFYPCEAPRGQNTSYETTEGLIKWFT